MKNDSAKKALKISVPAVIALVVLKLISVLINGFNEEENTAEELPQVYFTAATEGVAGEVTRTETAEETAITDEPEWSGDVTFEVSDEQTVTLSEDETVITEYAEYTEYRFRNSSLLNNHYSKHGVEMGFDSAEAYEKAASDVVNSPEALHKKEKEDNDEVYYIEATNEFVVVSADGYLRTYFLPDKGKAYYDKQ